MPHRLIRQECTAMGALAVVALFLAVPMIAQFTAGLFEICGEYFASLERYFHDLSRGP